ncbi:DEAD/DEAH box helicase [Cryptosporangium phraense]|uniref:DEAD/DEAH box helicase n=1 Tax=Cryptosporangium phraense TaxID=2593070 RepID=A0A545ANR7_9ACTN|nr:DEAD/DEAH box helicase [Cryptosporangium phraense]TQS42982.1 DEAD/DEAH box helicase [Cryptosporangium phraense]
MDKAERELVRALAGDLEGWSRRAAEVRQWRRRVAAAASEAERVLAARSVVLPFGRVVPFDSSDSDVVRALSDRARLPGADEAFLDRLTGEVRRALDEVAPVLGLRRFFVGSAQRRAAEAAAQYLRREHAALLAEAPVRLERMGTLTGAPVPLLSPSLGWPLVAAHDGPAPFLVDRAEFAGLPSALDRIAAAVAGEARYRSAAREAGEGVREAEVRRLLETMPVDALKQATRDRLRLGALADARLTTVQQVLDRGPALDALPGVGETTTRRILGAAHELRCVTHEETPVRIDVDGRPPEATELLRRLADWDANRETRSAADDLWVAGELAPLGAAIRPTTEYLLVLPSPPGRGPERGGLREGMTAVVRRAAMLDAGRRRAARPGAGRTAARPDAEPAAARAGAAPVGNRAGREEPGGDPWVDYLARPADYIAMLAELGFLTEDENAAHGDLPEDIIEAVREQPLRTEYLTASLRGYQGFAARFALVQHKVLVGDEMGLGKTLEALAVLAHLRSRGANRFLVVCPAAVVSNWVREVESKSRLVAHRVHGPDRERAAQKWLRDGGVAVTTYETLGWWGPALAEVGDLACVVVDEAHYVKNPAARRTVRTTALIEQADRAILLTGTPLENRVDEFRTLISYLRPDLVAAARAGAPRAFRRQVAPAYLRRNQEDVLTELPELIEVEEWLPLSADDSIAYREAVERGNFMAMRQAGMLQGTESEKMRRLVEIVAEAEENHRRVLVFSYFREVLDLVARSLPGAVFGPLTGSVPAGRRQELVDEFSAAEGGAALVAQIVAGGVGLNIQSASVVVLCEPQLKPTTETQAIARAHRMGQVQTVQVHRLLSEDSVDQRIVELLARKTQTFDEYARHSDLAAAPEAVDLSESELVRQVVATERARLSVPAH